MLQNVDLSSITKNKNNPKFNIEKNCGKFMQNCPLYNTKVCSQLGIHNFEYYFTTGRKDRYELLCDVDVYDRIHP